MWNFYKQIVSVNKEIILNNKSDAMAIDSAIAKGNWHSWQIRQLLSAS